MNIENNTSIIESLTNLEIENLFKILKEYHNPLWNIYGDNSSLLLKVAITTEIFFNFPTKYERLYNAILLDNIVNTFHHKSINDKKKHKEVVNYICCISDLKFDEQPSFVISIDSHEAALSWIVKYLNNLNIIYSNNIVFKKDWISTELKQKVFFETLENYIPDGLLFFEEITIQFQNQPKPFLTNYDIVQFLLSKNSTLIADFINKNLCYFTNPTENNYLDFIKTIDNKILKINLKEELHNKLNIKQEAPIINKV